MVRPKKDAPVAEGAAVAEAPPSSEGAADIKKPAARGRKPGKAASKPKPAPVHRTLRSNSSKTTLVEPETKVPKAQKQSGKGKKATSEEATVDSNEELEAMNGAAVTNGNGVASEEEKPKSGGKGKKTAPEKSTSGKKAAASNGTPDEVESTEKSNGAAAVDTEKDAKPVKSGKKKQAEKPASDEPKSEAPEETKDKDKTASGRGKKKADAPKEEEVAAPKKAKKEAKAVKPVETEPAKETEEAAKPAPAETKKAKGKGAKAKEVAIEHWNAERVKSILKPLCSPSTAFSTNKKAPRRGSFEITLIYENDEEMTIWSGIKRGPPRKEKFPSDEEVAEMAEKFFANSK